MFSYFRIRKSIEENKGIFSLLLKRLHLPLPVIESLPPGLGACWVSGTLLPRPARAIFCYGRLEARFFQKKSALGERRMHAVAALFIVCRSGLVAGGPCSDYISFTFSQASCCSFQARPHFDFGWR
jgi:hypothetical protein